MSKIHIRHIHKSYKSKVVLQDINMTCCQKEIIGLLGANGAGKTTLFSIISGVLQPSKGQIFYDEQDITELSLYERSQYGISYLAQEPSIFQGLTVQENILAILQYKYPKQITKQNKILNKIIEEFSLQEIRHSRANCLSGGERRRVEIARSLVINPKFLLLDEPFAGIDPIAIEEVSNLILALKSKGIGIFITDHNVTHVLKLVHKAYIVSHGTILFSGNPEEIIKNKKVQTDYLGQNF